LNKQKYVFGEIGNYSQKSITKIFLFQISKKSQRSNCTLQAMSTALVHSGMEKVSLLLTKAKWSSLALVKDERLPGISG
jgi:hypothetical protein